ncbi:MAG: exodeoxyribonuclease V subunit gamma [Calditerricola sp.]|nr:exodeoxyribonuclease V subunit gamma [Calditerricola sp.]
MPLRLLLGRAGSGKTQWCLDEIRARLEADPGGPPLFYVIPEAMTFQAERALASLPGLGGFARVRVVSFSRLAQVVLQEVGGSARRRLDGAGLALAVRRAMETSRDALGSLGRLADHPALITRLASLYRECRRSGIAPERLAQEARAMREGGDEAEARLAGKLDALARLFGEVERLLAAAYELPEDALWRCARRLGEAAVVREAEVWVDGFAAFSPHEWAVLEGLISHSRGVTVALCLDPRGLDDEAEADELDVFAPVRETAHALCALAERRGVPVEVVALPQGQRLPRFARRDDLAHLAQAFEGWPASPYSDVPRNIRLWAAANRQAEVEKAAREILRLVREEGYRWRDVAVLVSDEEAYFPHLARVFADYGIPVFLDGQKALRHHPLVELLRAAADVVAQEWAHEAVFRCLKTDLLFPPREAGNISTLREQVARLENVCLAHGIEGRAWTVAESWPELGADPELDDLRRRLTAPLRVWEEALSAATTVRDVAAAILRFLEASGVPDHLARWAAEAEARGDLDEALEHADAWEAAVRLLDQLVALMGSLRLGALPVVRLFVACLESATVRRIPPSRDQVLCGRFDRSRVSNVRCVLFLGLNEGMLEPHGHVRGLLAEEEYERLRARGVALAPTVYRRLVEAQLAVYEALASASHRLYLSFALADEAGNALQPAAVVKRIRTLFPRLAEAAVPDASPTAGTPGGEAGDFLWRPSAALRGLAVQLRRAQDGQPVDAVWWDAYNWLVAHPTWEGRVRAVARAAVHRNEEGPLAEETRRALYGPVLSVSASRLEAFAACPFRHFAAYALRLEPRRLARLEAADVGTLLHAALRIAVERLWGRGGWAAADTGTCRSLAAEAVALAAREVGVAARVRTHRLGHQLRVLTRVVADSLSAMAEQGRRSAFRPVALEAAFGAGRSLPGLRVMLADGTAVELVGRIDRVDVADVGGKRYVQVIDYKTGAASMTLAQVVHGLALQLPLYLEVALAAAEGEGREAVPAGMFLFHPHRPLVDDAVAQDETERDRLRLRAFRLRGFVTADAEAADLLDGQWAGGYSDVVPGYRKKDGTISGRGTDTVLTADQWAVLRRFVRAKVTRLAEEMAGGTVAIAPYQLKGQRACARCPYRPVCQFDALIDAPRVRLLPDVGGETAWQLMSKEGREGDAHRAPQAGGQHVDR